MQPSRRQFLSVAVTSPLTLSAIGASIATAAEPKANADIGTMLDCHTHFYDPTRPMGVPWPGKDDKILYRRVLPADYRKLADPLGVTGTVIVEASPWLEDNQWLLDLPSKEGYVAGIVGNLKPGTPTFAANLARFAKSPRWVGMRVNAPEFDNLDSESPILRDLKLLADANREIDINGGPALLTIVHRLADRVPSLRILINHCANLRIDGKSPPADWVEGMKAAAKHPNVYCKVSSLVGGAAQVLGRGAKIPSDTAFYKPVLDVLWNQFGPDRLIYGSDWPVSELFAPLSTVHAIVNAYFRDHGIDATRKFFAENAKRAYRLPMG